jgi:MoaA/NifB/PqqE/SkfB family radical SAM enzyme
MKGAKMMPISEKPYSGLGDLSNERSRWRGIGRADFYSLVTRVERAYGTIPKYLPLMNGRAFPPFVVVLELTYRCNLKCPHCYELFRPSDKNVTGKRLELTPAEIESIVEQLPRFTLITVNGGEIFVRSDLKEILSIILAKHRCHLYTNGTCITPEMARDLVNMGVSSMGISVDGPEEVHDSMRAPGSFSRTIESIRLLVDLKKRLRKNYPVLNLKTTITDKNVGHLSDMVQFAERLGLDYCTFQVLNNSIHMGGVSFQSSLDYSQPPPPITNVPLAVLRQQLNNIQELASKSRVRVRILPKLPVPSILAHYANRLKPSAHTCVSPWTTLYISPTGCVYPCLNYYVGNIREQPYRELWNSERYRQYRKRLIRNGQFADCVGCCDLIRKRSGQHESFTVPSVPR